jgi:hypothetical protein
MPTTTQDFALDPTARDATNRELGYFDNWLVPADNAQTRSLYSLLGSPQATQAHTTAAQPALAAGMLAPTALRHAGQQAGLVPGMGPPESQGQPSMPPGMMPLGDIHAAIQHLQANNPAVLDLIRQAAIKQFSSNASFVDPRFAHALAPVSNTTTDLSTSEQFMKWLSLALGAAGAFA